VIRHAVATVERTGWQPEIIVEMLPCCPVRPTGCVDEMIHAMLLTGAPSACTVAPARHNHPQWLVRLVDGRIHHAFPEYHPIDGPRRSEPIYTISSFLTACRRSKFETMAGTIGDYSGECLAMVYPETASVDIDTWEDFMLAETLMERKLKG
jgi:hypothetical protein